MNITEEQLMSLFPSQNDIKKSSDNYIDYGSNKSRYNISLAHRNGMLECIWIILDNLSKLKENGNK